VALLIAIVSLAAYFGTTSENPITGETQRVALKPDEEIALGLKSAPEITPPSTSPRPSSPRG